MHPVRLWTEHDRPERMPYFVRQQYCLLRWRVVKNNLEDDKQSGPALFSQNEMIAMKDTVE